MSEPRHREYEMSPKFYAVAKVHLKNTSAELTRLGTPTEVIKIVVERKDYDELLAVAERMSDEIESLKQQHQNWINGARADVVYENMEKIFIGSCLTEYKQMRSGK